ncbi:MAG: hypothetical protein AB7G93_05095 [Bdellovibrionales bacterium]
MRLRELFWPRRVAAASVIIMVISGALTPLGADAQLTGEPFDREVHEVFLGTQQVEKSPLKDLEGRPVGVPEDQLVPQPQEIREWSYVYLFRGTRQIKDFITIDIRKKKDSGEILKKICNHFVNPTRMAPLKYAYTVIDEGKNYDSSCSDTTTPLGPRRVIVQWRKIGRHSVVDRLVFSNFIAGASSYMVGYGDWSRSRRGDIVTSDILFPQADDSSDIKERRQSRMKRVKEGLK